MSSTFIYITPGCGGEESQDFAFMLALAYQRVAQRFDPQCLRTFAQHPGPYYRLQFAGRFTRAIFRNEAGIHRLVRVSPFDPKKRRHASFVRVEVYHSLLAYYWQHFVLNPLAGFLSHWHNFSEPQLRRSYIFAPYKMIKDHRTGHETVKVREFFDGEWF